MKKIILLSIGFVVGLSIHPAQAAAEGEILVSKVLLDFTPCKLLSNIDRTFSYEKACIQSYYDAHPFTKTSFQPWTDSIHKKIDERLVEASPEIIQYLTLDGLLWGFPYENISGQVEPKLLANAYRALNALPIEIRKYIDDRFYGFMIVSGVGWTGYSPEINETPGGPLKKGAVIIINADNIKDLTLNQWLEFKENTALNLPQDPTQAKKYHLSMNFSRKGRPSTTEDNLKQFLLHECAHIVAMAVPSAHPALNRRNKEIPVSEFEKVNSDGVAGFPFLKTTWLPVRVHHTDGSEDAYKLVRKVPFKLNQIFAKKRVKYYISDPAQKFTAEEATTIYNGLNQSCFGSLYSTVDFAEDFAETVTQYFLTYKDSYDYSVKLTKKNCDHGRDRVVAKFKSPIWKNRNCYFKLRYMRSLFEN